jgi:hypothetical protein
VGVKGKYGGNNLGNQIRKDRVKPKQSHHHNKSAHVEAIACHLNQDIADYS